MFHRLTERDQVSMLVWGHVPLRTQMQFIATDGLCDALVMDRHALKEKLHLFWNVSKISTSELDEVYKAKQHDYNYYLT